MRWIWWLGIEFFFFFTHSASFGWNTQFNSVDSTSLPLAILYTLYSPYLSFDTFNQTCTFLSFFIFVEGVAFAVRCVLVSIDSYFPRHVSTLKEATASMLWLYVRCLFPITRKKKKVQTLCRIRGIVCEAFTCMLYIGLYMEYQRGFGASPPASSLLALKKTGRKYLLSFWFGIFWRDVG